MAFGCKPYARPPRRRQQRRDALAALERETGQPWSIRWQDDLPTAAFLEGRTRPLALTSANAEQAGRAFILRYPELFGLTEDDQLDVDESTIDELGMIHTIFTQHRGRVPVWGGELRAHFAPDGALVRINGRSIPIADLPLVPVRSSDEARASALLDAEALRPEVNGADFSSLDPSLWIFPRGADGARLTWQVQIDVHDGVRPMVLETFVDASDGSIVARTDTLTALSGSGKGVFGELQVLTINENDGAYWLEDPSRGVSPTQKTYSASNRAHLPGTGVHSDDPSGWDLAGDAAGAAVDAHAYVARTWDYFRDVHGRDGWDGKGHGVHATVHFGDHYAGAFFDGRQLVFGDGGADWAPASGALDVVAHEFTHGLTYQTAHLAPTGESGALDEAIADLFSCFVGFGAVAGGDWLIGETVYHPSGHPAALRDLASPHSTGNPETMDELVVTSDDNGGVHRNSTIASHAGYLMSEGAPSVDGLGAEATARIWYRALTRYLTSQARFADAADATVAAARDFGHGEEGAVRAAWLAAGVLHE